MVNRRRLVVAALVVAAGAALFALGSGPPAPGGSVATNALPSADVTTAPADEGRGTVTVTYAGTGDWEEAALTVDWNTSLTIVEGDRRLATVGASVELAEPAGAGPTPVEVTVTATGEGRAVVVYREEHII